MNDALQKKLDHLPKRPGVYKHLDAEGNVLYVGKAKNLRSRVRSYFHRSRPRDGRSPARPTGATWCVTVADDVNVTPSAPASARARRASSRAGRVR